jgi:uncharacterized membrane protein
MPVAACSTVVGVFNVRSKADQAIDDLGKAGFRDDDIGVVTRDEQGMAAVQKKVEAETSTGKGTAAGIVAGAGIGGLVGLGVLAGVIPVIGPAIAAGTLATILTNAAGGAAIAGLSGALIGWGVSEEHAKYYDSQLHAGRVIVTVQAGDRCDLASTVLERHGGYSHKLLETASA